MMQFVPGPSRLSHLVDAATLAYSAAAVVVLVLMRASALGALGVVFALPVLLAAGMRIARGLHFALTGRELRLTPTGQTVRPPARLGRH